MKLAGISWVVALLLAATLRGAAAEGFVLPVESLYATGRFVYERNCLVCHGRWGEGDGEMAKGMIPKPRKFSSGIFKYRSTPAGALPTDDDLMRTVRGGRANTSMPSFTHLSDREVRAVVESIKFFSPRWRKPKNHAAPVKLPEPPAWLAEPPATARRAEMGRLTFIAACSLCHGAEGDGKGPSALALMDAWGDPCPPANLRTPALRNGRAPADYFRVLTLGIHGTPMPSFAEALTEEQRWDMAAFLGTLRPMEAGVARR